jgi:hypothetical protein
MRVVAIVFSILATAAALYDGKLLVWDIAVGDLRQGNGGVLMVILSVLVTAAFLALPLWAGLRWASPRPWLALGASLASLVLSAIGFYILAAAFTP